MRKWASLKLVRLAVKLWPENPEVKRFWAKCLSDALIVGRVVTRGRPVDMYKGEDIVTPVNLFEN